ncbi:MAG TPA: DUF1987 domain-containing protein [Spirochaetes bacterium]|nr:DUF1987 domain-containing protein [Spirochaetota bacterium]
MMNGELYPENATAFFTPLINWLEGFLGKKNEPITCNINIPYFNTSSSKYLMHIFEMLNRAHKKEKKIIINWYYEEGDEMSMECGEEFQEDLDLQFELVEKKS